MKQLIVAVILIIGLAGCTQAAPPPAPSPTNTPAPPPTDTPPPAEAAVAEAESTQPYTVVIEPTDFVEGIDNPYFLIAPDAKYVYEGKTEDGLERIEVEMLDETKMVMGVTATVVRDTVTLEGEVIEDTLDWYAQDKAGNVWYMGEDSKEYEDGKLVGTEGSWEAGVDGALPGIITYADPAAHIGQPYHQEYYEGEAEDMAELLSVDESVTVAYGSFDNLVLVKEWNPFEPDVVEHKYFAAGLGLILEMKVEGGSERVELVEIQTQD